MVADTLQLVHVALLLLALASLGSLRLRFLGRFGILGCFLGSLGANTMEAGGGTGRAQDGIWRKLAIVGRDNASLLLLDDGVDGHDGLGNLLSKLDLLRLNMGMLILNVGKSTTFELKTYSGIRLLGFLSVAREEDDAAPVDLQALCVQLQRLDRLVATAVVHRNADGWGKTLGNLGGLQEIQPYASSVK